MRLGLTSFGGPAAHIALMRDEFVRRRAWLDDAAFVDLIGAANLIPGPTSTEVAMHIGHRRAGWTGLIVAGLAFLLPAVIIVGVLAWAYVEFGSLPAVGALLIGIAPVVVAIVAHAGWSIARTAVRTWLGLAIAVVAVAATLAGVPEIVVLLGLGAVASLWRLARRTGSMMAVGAIGWIERPPTTHGDQLAMAILWAVDFVAVSPLAILGEFLKVGSVLFGSGYVLVALLRAELVDGLGWISEGQLVDAVAVGAATPGPLFSTATFLGYLVGGPVGAVVATVGIFLPAFVAVALSVPLLDRLRRSALFRAFLDGVNAAVVGLLGVVAAHLAIAVVTDPVAVAVALVAFGLLLRGVGTGWLVGLGVAVGLARLALGSG